MLIWEMLDRPIAVHRVFIDLVGVKAGVFLSQAVYWTRRTTNREGWFYKTQADWEDEVGMSRAEQETARQKLRAAGLLAEKLAGVPARLFFKVEVDALTKAVQQYKGSLRKCPLLADPKAADEYAEILQSGRPMPAVKSAGKSQTKVKAETTAETTAKTTAVAKRRHKRAQEVGEGAQVVEPKPIVLLTTAGREVELPGDMGYPRDPASKSFKTWANYAVVFQRTYSVWPVFNARQAKLCTQLVDLVGSEVAPKLVAFYIRHKGDSYVVKEGHPLSLLVKSAETWLVRAQGASVARSEGEAKAASQIVATGDSVADALEMRRARHAH